MINLELNKIIASILLASLIAMLSGFIANILYKPELEPKERGYKIEVSGITIHSNTQEEIIDIKELMISANAKIGERAARKCVSCHSFEKDGKNKIGPNLWNIVGAKQGSKDFTYSRAMLKQDDIWNEANLFAFLKRPSKYIPGTKMSFIGIKKPEDIANIIAYLKSKGE